MFFLPDTVKMLSTDQRHDEILNATKYLKDLQEYGRNTHRKLTISVNKDIAECKVMVDHLTKRLKQEKKFFAYYLGEKYTVKDLIVMREELRIIEISKDQIKNVQF